MMMKIAIAAVFVAAVSAQLSPQQQARLDQLLDAHENSELAALLAADGLEPKERIAENNDAVEEALSLQKLIPIKVVAGRDGVTTSLKPGQDAEYSRLVKQDADLTAIEAELASLQDQFDSSIGDVTLASTIAAAVNATLSTDDVLLGLVQEQAALRATLGDALDASASHRDDQIAQFKKEADGYLATAVAALDEEVKARKAGKKAVDDKLADFGKATDEKLKAVDELPDTLAKNVDEALKPVSAALAVLERVKLTYVSDPKIPVFRWQWWQTFDQSFGWFDGNNGRSFGGVAPSSWTDNNHRAWDMNSDWKYIKRFFIRTGTSNKYGATICSECYIMYSSTTGRMCGVVFRIKNLKTSSVSWNPEFMYTSWTGWGEDASASLNGASNWRHSCGGSYCRSSLSFSIPGNSQKDRVSTIIFTSSGTNTYHVGYNRWERANINMFNDNSLALNEGLEYVNDMDALSGSWKE